jgi:hypothetical protein
MSSIKEIAVSLLAKVQKLQGSVTADLSSLQQKCAVITKAAETVAHSWSGSSMGYHSELYYRNFERPPLGAEFSPEWGGIHGIPAGWQKRSSDEVKAHIEKLAGVLVADIEKGAETALSEAKALYSEMVTEISGLHTYPGLEQEKRLLSELEKFKWGMTINEYMDANLPKTYISRDSEAVYQGVKVSAHLYYAGVAFEKNSECIAIQHFFKAATRLLRQIELNTGPMGLTDGAEQQPVKDVLWIYDRFHVIARQLV